MNYNIKKMTRTAAGSKTSKTSKTLKKSIKKSESTAKIRGIIDVNNFVDYININEDRDHLNYSANESKCDSRQTETEPKKLKRLTKKQNKIPVMNTILEEPDTSVREKNEPLLPLKCDVINKNILNNFVEAKKFLTEHNITISTITLNCKLHTMIDVDTFAKNVILREDEIVSVKFGNRKDPATNRTIVIIKAKKKPSAKNFYNQVTILMKPMNNPSRNYINIKVFKNGSLQMTGCKDMDDFNNVTTTLIDVLKKGRDIKSKSGKTTHIDFVTEPEKIGIFDVKIRMINSNFKLDYKVDRKKLARLLRNKHGTKSKDKEFGYIECKYEPSGGHSCVNIKYEYDENNRPSIFVFQTGSVIITGAKNLNHIIDAYKFIHRVLDRYYDAIKIIDLDQKLVQAELLKFYKSHPTQLAMLEA